MSGEAITFGTHDLCPRCKAIGRDRKPYARGWVWANTTFLRPDDVILETITNRPGGTWYRIQCRVCHGKGYIVHEYKPVEKVG